MIKALALSNAEYVYIESTDTDTFSGASPSRKIVHCHRCSGVG